MISFKTNVKEISGVAKTIASRLKKLEIEKVSDLIYYFPVRYDDFSQISKIADLKSKEFATVKGKIELIQNKRTYRKRMFVTEAVVSDGTDSIIAIWFNQPFITKLLKVGDQVYLSGRLEVDFPKLQFSNPSYEKVKKEQTHTARIVPLYSLTANITQKQLRYLIKSVLPIAEKIPDWLPGYIKEKHNLIGLSEALNQIHFPKSQKSLEEARRRLKFNELLLIQIGALKIKEELEKSRARIIKFNEKKTRAFVKSLPFELTNSQKKSSWEILKDLGRKRPLNRLLEGDVGSGKTIVAALAILNTFLNGYQSAFMAPTEILAFQHFESLSKFFEKYDIEIGLLTSAYKKISPRDKVTKSALAKKIKSGDLDLIIGTHALIQEKITFKNLALTIVDEQHRFGVEQRKNLKEKNSETTFTPHLLSMTATPIPRSLALTLYGDLDLSIISEMPKGRKKIITQVIPPDNRKKAYQFIRQEIKKGSQVFVVCPLIEESDKLGVKAVTTEYEKLDKEIFPDLEIGLLHGKLKSKSKEKVMKDFVDNKLNIIVTTAVVEVGVDVPNATIMMIEGAERFGLAQLHQFRGRVGRGQDQSYCFLFTESSSDKTQKRLEALVTAKNGFELAEKDLELRGPGEIYGNRQSGLPDLKIASLSDLSLIKETGPVADEILKNDSIFNKFPLLSQKIAQLKTRIHPE